MVSFSLQIYLRLWRNELETTSPSGPNNRFA
jgi:hypothetical protein